METAAASAGKLEFLSAADKPALIAAADPDLQESVRAVLEDLGYKVHGAADHDEFVSKFSQAAYQVVVMEERFGAASTAENQSLIALQQMPMNQRRHAVIVLVSASRPSLNVMEAFSLSVHAVLNRSDLEALGQILLKVISDNDLFLNLYRDTQSRIAQSR